MLKTYRIQVFQPGDLSTLERAETALSPLASRAGTGFDLGSFYVAFRAPDDESASLIRDEFLSSFGDVENRMLTGYGAHLREIEPTQ